MIFNSFMQACLGRAEEYPAFSALLSHMLITLILRLAEASSDSAKLRTDT
jgi:hypothetical protein